MKPPWMSPSSARQARKLLLPLSQNWHRVTMAMGNIESGSGRRSYKARLTPQAHLSRDPAIRTDLKNEIQKEIEEDTLENKHLFADQLTGQFSNQEGDSEDGVSQIEVVSGHS